VSYWERMYQPIQGPMNEADLGPARDELTRLEAEEALLSAQRRHLHQKIDFGYATDESRAREREISDQRQALHRRIDELRELLGTQPLA
jgi:hypothetical protein